MADRALASIKGACETQWKCPRSEPQANLVYQLVLNLRIVPKRLMEHDVDQGVMPNAAEEVSMIGTPHGRAKLGPVSVSI